MSFDFVSLSMCSDGLSMVVVSQCVFFNYYFFYRQLYFGVFLLPFRQFAN